MAYSHLICLRCSKCLDDTADDFWYAVFTVLPYYFHWFTKTNGKIYDIHLQYGYSDVISDATSWLNWTNVEKQKWHCQKQISKNAPLLCARDFHFAAFDDIVRWAVFFVCSFPATFIEEKMKNNYETLKGRSDLSSVRLQLTSMSYLASSNSSHTLMYVFVAGGYLAVSHRFINGVWILVLQEIDKSKHENGYSKSSGSGQLFRKEIFSRWDQTTRQRVLRCTPNGSVWVCVCT